MGDANPVWNWVGKGLYLVIAVAVGVGLYTWLGSDQFHNLLHELTKAVKEIRGG